MCSLPSFLPLILELRGCWEDILNILYDIFKTDFLDQNLFYDELRVVFDKRKGDDNKEMIFWHLITKVDKKYGRIPDFKRAERLPWNRPIIENHMNAVIKEWNNLEGSGRIRKYLWLENYNFCVVLELRENKSIIILITAFYVEEYKKRDLLRRFQRRIVNTA